MALYILRHSGKAPKEFLFYLDKELKSRKKDFYYFYGNNISDKNYVRKNKENAFGYSIL